MRLSLSPLLASLWMACVSLPWLMGCASDHALNDPNFGSTVRHQIAVQTANPGRSAYGLDGQKMALALSQYRQDVATPKTVDTMALGTVTTGTSSQSGTSGQSGGSGR